MIIYYITVSMDFILYLMRPWHSILLGLEQWRILLITIKQESETSIKDLRQYEFGSMTGKRELDLSG